MDKFFLRHGDSKYGLLLQEYNGKWSLVQASIGAEDKAYPVFNFKSSWDKVNKKQVPSDKKEPVGIRLGDANNARETLEYFLSLLNEVYGEAPADDDIPF